MNGSGAGDYEKGGFVVDGLVAHGAAAWASRFGCKMSHQKHLVQK